jgi:hypothetical protein
MEIGILSVAPEASATPEATATPLPTGQPVTGTGPILGVQPTEEQGQTLEQTYQNALPAVGNGEQSTPNQTTTRFEPSERSIFLYSAAGFLALALALLAIATLIHRNARH